MTIYYLKASGSNTAPYDTWAKAANSPVTLSALTLGATDIVYADSALAFSVAAGTTLTTAPGGKWISTSDTTNMPPTTYNVGASIVTTGGNGLTIQGGAWYGFTLRAGNGGVTASLNLCTLNNASAFFQDCTLSSGTSVATARISFGSNTTSVACAVETRNCSFTFGGTGQGFLIRSIQWRDIGSNLDAGATHPTNLFASSTSFGVCLLIGSDLSGNTGTYFQGGASPYEYRLIGCKLGVAANLTATFTADGTGEIWMTDCSSGNVNYALFHQNYRGATLATASVYLNTSDGANYDGSSHYGWTVGGNANTSPSLPYYSPVFGRYTAGGSAVTPYFEIARDGSTTPYTDAQVWAQFTAKTNASFPIEAFYSDQCGVVATPANQANGIGTGSWTGLSGTAWSGKCDSGSSLTVQQVGVMLGRVALGDNITVYVNPRILGL